MTAEFRRQFQELVSETVEAQLEFFLKRYIFVLGDWTEVTNLANKFSKYTEARNDTYDLNVTEAADFLQKNGKTRTAAERKEELKDIDLDNNGRIAFIEYLILHFKVMVLKEFYNKKGKPIPRNMDLSRDGIGITGVGDVILEALFTFGTDIDPKIEAAIEEVMNERKARENEVQQLTNVLQDQSKSKVQRMKAQHELFRIERSDTSQANAALISLLAGRRRVQRQARNDKEQNEKALRQNKEAMENEKKKIVNASKNKLKNMQNLFKKNAHTDESAFVGRGRDRASIRALEGRGRPAI